MPCVAPAQPLAYLDGRRWACVDFISDLHLQASEPLTFQAFQVFLQQTPADALFVLGDLFEVWVGDDVLTDSAAGFERSCVEALARVSARLQLFWLPGNRDFLTGPGFAVACKAKTLCDPCVLQLGDEWCLLSHGDALCLQDSDYLAFRQQVRSARWQADFMAKPLPVRQSLARQMREQSRARAQSRSPSVYADVDSNAALDILRQTGTTRLIHGHTHRPQDHDLGGGLSRSVLSDWCLDTAPARSQVLRWQQGWHRISGGQIATSTQEFG